MLDLLACLQVPASSEGGLRQALKRERKRASVAASDRHSVLINSAGEVEFVTGDAPTTPT